MSEKETELEHNGVIVKLEVSEGSTLIDVKINGILLGWINRDGALSLSIGSKIRPWS